MRRDSNRGLWSVAFVLAALISVMVALTVLKSGFDMMDAELLLVSFLILVIGTEELRKVKVNHLK